MHYRLIFVSNPENGLLIYVADRDFKKVKQIYHDQNMTCSDVRGGTGITVEGEDGKKWHFNGVMGLENFIVFGRETFKLYVGRTSVNNKIEIVRWSKDGTESFPVPTMGNVDNRYGGYVGGDYTFYRINRSKESLQNTIPTTCNGSIVSQGRYLFCADKNTEKLYEYKMQ